MLRFRPVLGVLFVLLASCAEKPNAGDPAPNVADDVKQLRDHFAAERNDGRCGFGLERDPSRYAFEEGLCELTLGESRTFAACAFILTNQPDDQERAEVFLLLSRRKGDRSQFVPLALEALRHADEWVRTCAVTLLGKIGTPNQIPALRAMLDDADSGVVSTTAEVLASIGGPDDLIAVGRWLAGPGRAPEVAFTSDVVAGHRDALKARLTAEGKWPADPRE